MTVVINGTTGISTPGLSNSSTSTNTGNVNNSGTVTNASTISVGNATPAASGAGITFPVTQNPSSDANTLDDYEEGTWSPTLITDGGGQSVTHTQQRGTYTKVGRVVTLTWYLGWSAFTGGSSGVRISNLPFTSQNTGSGVYYAGANAEHSSSIAYSAGRTALTYELAQNSATILPNVNGTGVGAAPITRTDVGTGSGYFIGSITYESA